MSLTFSRKCHSSHSASGGTSRSASGVHLAFCEVLQKPNRIENTKQNYPSNKIIQNKIIQNTKQKATRLLVVGRERDLTYIVAFGRDMKKIHLEWQTDTGPCHCTPGQSPIRK